MRSLTIYGFIALLASPLAVAQSYPVYSNGSQFADPDASVYTLACGPVLAAQGYTTIGNITGPGLAGFVNITAPDSPLCGEYAVLGSGERSVAVHFVDGSVDGGIVLTEAVYDDLAGTDTPPSTYTAEIWALY